MTLIEMMAIGLASKKQINEASFPSKPKKRKTSYRDYHIDLQLTEDDLP